MTYFLWSVFIYTFTHIQRWCHRHGTTRLRIYKCRSDLSVIFQPQGAMTHCTLRDSDNSVDKTTICFRDDEQMFGPGRCLHAENGHPLKRDAHAQDLSWTKMFVVAGSNVEKW